MRKLVGRIKQRFKERKTINHQQMLQLMREYGIGTKNGKPIQTRSTKKGGKA